MKKLLAFFILIVFSSGFLMAQKTKGQKKAKLDKEEVEMPPPPPMEELKNVRIDTSSVPVGIKNEEFSKEDFFFNTIDTAAAPDDSLTRELINFLNITGALNLGVQLAKSMNKDKGDDILPQEFYDRIYKEMTEGESKRYFETIIVKIYRKYFTVEDVQRLIEFYSSETGKKSLAMMPSAMAEIQQMSSGFGRMLGMKIYNDLLKEGKINIKINSYVE